MGAAPSNSSNSSLADGAEAAERGRSPLATSVARAMKVDKGTVTPMASLIRFWVESTASKEIDTAIEISDGNSGTNSSGAAAAAGAGAGGAGGGAILMLLRSKCPIFSMRAACSAG